MQSHSSTALGGNDDWHSQISWSEVFSNRRALCVGVGIMIIQVGSVEIGVLHCAIPLCHPTVPPTVQSLSLSNKWCTLCVTVQALTGINAVIFFSTTIFEFAGFNQAILVTVSVGSKS